jgi:type IV pilus assembly protein PilO
VALNLDLKNLNLKNINLEGILKVPLKVKVGIVAGIVLVFWGLYGGIVVYPKIKKMNTLKIEINELTAKRDAKKKDASNLPKLKEEVKRLERDLVYSMTVLPNTEEIPKLLDAISNNMRFYNLEILSFKPEQESKKDFYAEIPLNFRFSGSYKEIGEFIQTIGRYPRIINMATITLRDPKIKNNRIVLTAEAKAYTYRFLKEEEMPKQQPQQKKEEKKK